MKKTFLVDLSLERSNNEDENNVTDHKVDARRTFSIIVVPPDLSLEGSNNEYENNGTGHKVDARRIFSGTDMAEKNVFA